MKKKLIFLLPFLVSEWTDNLLVLYHLFHFVLVKHFYYVGIFRFSTQKRVQNTYENSSEKKKLETIQLYVVLRS